MSGKRRENNKNKRMRCIQAGLLAMLIFAAMGMLMMTPAQAASVPEPDQSRLSDCSLTVHAQYGTTALTGVNFQVVKVADMSVSGQNVHYTLTGNFQNAGISLDNLTASGMRTAAIGLYKVMQSSGAASRQVVTDASGNGSLAGLAAGMYLVVQPNAHSQGGRSYVTDPFLISLPLLQTSGNVSYWSYQVTADPKAGTGTGETNGSGGGESTDPESPKPSDPSGSSSSGSSSGGSGSTSNTSAEPASSGSSGSGLLNRSWPKTGDPAKLEIWGGLLLGSGLALAVMMAEKRKKSREQK